MIKILVLFSGCGIGGAERSLTRMVNVNKDKNITYQVATFSTTGDWSEWANDLNLRPICFGNRFFSLIKYIRQNNYQFVYIIGFRLSIYLRFIKFLLPNVKLIQGVRWNPNSQSKLDKVFRFIERYFSFLMTTYITNSKIAKEQLLQLGINKNKVEVIYNGIEIIKTKQIEKQQQVITVANLSERKGYIAYLSIIENVLKVVPEVRFLFVGRDDSKNIVETIIKKKGLEKNVFCLGFREDIPDLLQQSSIFVLPSLYGEGCPTSILESFANKLPVVAYAIDGIPELLNDEKDGLLSDKCNATSMSNNIIELLKNPKKAQQFGEMGYQKVKEKFTLEVMLEKHNNYFKSIK
jgi:glycosyltransferase involved in cell wall biosynthesis